MIRAGLLQNFKSTIPCFSMIYHDQQCNFHDYLMHSLQHPLFTMLSINVECSNKSMLVDMMHAFWNNKNLKPPVARKLGVRQLVFWLLVVLSNYFTKFNDFSMILQFFSNSMHACNFYSDFPGFPWFQELVGTLLGASCLTNIILASPWGNRTDHTWVVSFYVYSAGQHVLFGTS